MGSDAAASPATVVDLDNPQEPPRDTGVQQEVGTVADKRFRMRKKGPGGPLDRWLQWGPFRCPARQATTRQGLQPRGALKVDGCYSGIVVAIVVPVLLACRRT